MAGGKPMAENEAKTSPSWLGWPSEEGLAGYSEIGLASLPYGSEAEEQVPPDPEQPKLPDEEPAPPGFSPAWDLAQGRFADEGAQRLLLRLCGKDGLDVAAAS